MTVLAVVALVIGWIALSRDGGDGDSDASGCISGDMELLVWTDPAAESTARMLVDRYAATDPVVRDHCVHARVELRDTESALDAYRSEAAGVAPVWLPVGDGLTDGLTGAPEETPVVGNTDDGRPVQLAVFGSSPAVPEEQARAGADFSRVTTGG